MARYNYSMKRRDKKLAGRCSTIGVQRQRRFYRTPAATWSNSL
jgi:hypothetical protein